MAVDVFILAVDVMKSALPFSGHTYIVTDRNYPISFTDIVVGLVSLEVNVLQSLLRWSPDREMSRAPSPSAYHPCTVRREHRGALLLNASSHFAINSRIC